ncbi:MAG TPA: hypothetical protein VGO68_11385 [Pyrinomonadaceae bacterium]|jgi:hypothetical protein|nr:hypothetical protein [Pyrinomonadaceae bacterium]
MSIVKTKTLNPRIKISRSGRAYVDVADLVKSRLARIAKVHQKPNGNTVVREDAVKAENNNNKSNSGER